MASSAPKSPHCVRSWLALAAALLLALTCAACSKEQRPLQEEPPSSDEQQAPTGLAIAAAECEPRLQSQPPQRFIHHGRYGLGEVYAAVERGTLTPDTLPWAEAVLTETEAFVGRYGNQDDNPIQRRALLVVLSLPKAEAAESLSRVLADGHTPGKLYALIGLREVDPDEFDRHAMAFAESDEWVLFLNYDMVDCERVGELIRSPSGARDISGGDVGRRIINDGELP